mmetsp:Transcript_17156/g.38634  ORF Transcript_17156/g.38634 Transcript_17156/m.38634 type:complete len:540 (-) Transcript_17156:1127-2746(-)
MLALVEEPVEMIAILFERGENSPSEQGISGIVTAVLEEVLKHEHVKNVDLIGYEVDQTRSFENRWKTDHNLSENSDCLRDKRVKIFDSVMEVFDVDNYCKKKTENTDGLESSVSKSDDYYHVLVLLDAFNFLLYEGDDHGNADVDFDYYYNASTNAAAENIAIDGISKKKLVFDMIYGAVASYGAIVMGLGSQSDPKFWRNYDLLIKLLNEYDFHAIYVYEENDCGIVGGCTFLVMSTDLWIKKRWFMNQAELDVQIHKQLNGPSKVAPMKSFRGISMLSYQVPHKVWENRVCGGQLPPLECTTMRGINPRVTNYSMNRFEVKNSSMGENVGRGIFAKEYIPKGSLIMQEKGKESIHVTGTTLNTIDRLYYAVEKANIKNDILPNYENWETLNNYIFGYGMVENLFAYHEVFVDSGISTFINHGCKGTANIGQLGVGYTVTFEDHKSLTEEIAHSFEIDDLRKHFTGTSKPYSPVFFRHTPLRTGGLVYALRNIEAGEELFSNYLLYSKTEEYWLDWISELVAQCSGGVGLVVEVDSKV